MLIGQQYCNDYDDHCGVVYDCSNCVSIFIYLQTKNNETLNRLQIEI